MDHNYEGCPIFVYDENGNYIIRTSIMEFDSNKMSVSISAETEGIERGAHLIIMIVHSNGVSEYNGIAREVIFHMREISLFKGQHRRGRAHTRFRINALATVQSLTVNSNKITFPAPQNICVVDISKSGLLIKASKKFFNVGNILEICMNIDDKDVLLHARAKRESPRENGTFDYGCSFIHNN